MLKNFLSLLVEKKGTNLFLSPGSLPSIKLGGELVQVGKRILTPEDTREMALKLLNRDQVAEFDALSELDLAVDEPRVGRFGVNIFKQRNNIAMVFRMIRAEIPSCKDLGLPKNIRSLVNSRQGLIFLTGSQATSKATTLAALVDQRNSTKAGHILTLESPIEFVHKHKHCIVNQREIGSDTPSFEQGINHATRQAPDMLIVGHIDSHEVMHSVLQFVLSGRLCIVALHADNPAQAIDRIINMYPTEQHQQLYLDLSLCTTAVLAQRLTPNSKDDKAQTIDVMSTSPVIKDLIKLGQSHKIKGAVKSGDSSPEMNFDAMLYELFHARQKFSPAPAKAGENRKPAQNKQAEATAKAASAWQVEPLDDTQGKESS
ncbi:MAG: Flp pilus assembly complex ATPase component TadA [Gammaproteobacteria bacterium]|nr:Flp pilus assembly complex ATPase component TadA [Gammaproteobacteria bacterium]